jgi:hypothetical protein
VCRCVCVCVKPSPHHPQETELKKSLCRPGRLRFVLICPLNSTLNGPFEAVIAKTKNASSCSTFIAVKQHIYRVRVSIRIRSHIHSGIHLLGCAKVVQKYQTSYQICRYSVEKITRKSTAGQTSPLCRSDRGLNDVQPRI